MPGVERYGVVTREAVLAEGIAGGFTSVYGVLKVLEERGQVRRGYFVDGLGAAQFAVPGAVDRLRAARETPDPLLHPENVPDPIGLATTDPAQPFGGALDWPATAGRPARNVSSLTVLRAGEPPVWFDTLPPIHTSEPTRQADIPYVVFCLQKKTFSSTPLLAPYTFLALLFRLLLSQPHKPTNK